MPIISPIIDKLADCLVSPIVFEFVVSRYLGRAGLRTFGSRHFVGTRVRHIGQEGASVPRVRRARRSRP
jgi:hypothetical protein